MVHASIKHILVYVPWFRLRTKFEETQYCGYQAAITLDESIKSFQSFHMLLTFSASLSKQGEVQDKKSIHQVT